MPQVAVVTGAASGLGRALAANCAALGMNVALFDLDAERVANEASAIAAEHRVETIGGRADVGDGQSVNEAAETVRERFGRTDLVISNVGVQLFGALDVTTDDQWRWVLDVNVVGSARVARAFLPMLRVAPEPHLAFTSSSSVFDPASRLGMYQTSKFAVWGLAESLRVELAPDNIGVSVVFPSGMMSRHLETSEAAQPEGLRRPVAADDDFLAVYESNPTMATFIATPEDAAAGVVEQVLAGVHYVITHGAFGDAIDKRDARLRAAAEAGQTRSQSG
jgi:NAD(P)-dependent dehydrogenase (short-subunit alcohol dehydrogenase family)